MFLALGLGLSLAVNPRSSGIDPFDSLRTVPKRRKADMNPSCQEGLNPEHERWLSGSGASHPRPGR